MCIVQDVCQFAYAKMLAEEKKTVLLDLVMKQHRLFCCCYLIRCHHYFHYTNYARWIDYSRLVCARWFGVYAIWKCKSSDERLIFVNVKLFYTVQGAHILGRRLCTLAFHAIKSRKSLFIVWQCRKEQEVSNAIQFCIRIKHMFSIWIEWFITLVRGNIIYCFCLQVGRASTIYI